MIICKCGDMVIYDVCVGCKERVHFCCCDEGEER